MEPERCLWFGRQTGALLEKGERCGGGQQGWLRGVPPRLRRVEWATREVRQSGSGVPGDDPAEVRRAADRKPVSQAALRLQGDLRRDKTRLPQAGRHLPRFPNR